MKHHVIAVYMAILPLSASAAPGSMNLVGSGEVFYLGFIKIYDAELYTQNPGDTSRILSPDISKCLKLDYNVSLKPSDFVKGATMVLSRQHSSDDLDLIRPHMNRLHEAYVGVSKGDSYQLCYDAATSRTSLSLNGKELVSIISRQFSASYFGIWLSSEQPLSPSLQQDLLGTGTQRKPEDRSNG